MKCPFLIYEVTSAHCPYLVNGDCDEVDTNPSNIDSFCGAAVEMSMTTPGAIETLNDAADRARNITEALEGLFERRKKLTALTQEELDKAETEGEFNHDLKKSVREKTIHVGPLLEAEFNKRGIAIDGATGAVYMDPLQKPVDKLGHPKTYKGPDRY